MLIGLLQNIKHLAQTVLVNLVDRFATYGGAVRPKSLLLVHMDAIGDYVLLRNFIAVLREDPAYGEYRITLCGNAAYRELAETLDGGYLDDFIWIDRGKFRYNILYRFRLVREIGQRGFEVAVSPAYSRIYYWGDTIVRASGARERIGSSGDTTNIKGWQKRISDGFYTRLIPATGRNLFEFLRNREFFENFLGRRVPLIKPAIDVGILPPNPWGDRYAVLFPGAGARFREWGTGNFARLADYLWDRYRLTAVLAGSGRDRRLAEEIIRQTAGGKVVDVTGKTSLSQLAGIIAGAELLVSNETSAVHLAVAVDTRVVCISNGNQFGRFSPYPSEMYDKAHYVYPAPIMAAIHHGEALGEKYRHRSRLDINGIRVDEVQQVVDLAMR